MTSPWDQPSADNQGNPANGGPAYPNPSAQTPGPPAAYGAPSSGGYVSPEPPKKGRSLVGILVVVAVIAVIGVGGYFLYNSIFKPGNGGSVGDVDSVQTVPALDMRAGNCIETISSIGMVEEVGLVPCAQPHQAEVFAEYEITDDDFAGENAYDTQADEFCYSEAISLADQYGYSDELLSSLDLQYFVPSQDTWNAGDRLIVCLVRGSSGDLTGSYTAGSLE